MYALMLFIVIARGPLGYEQKAWVPVDFFEHVIYNHQRFTPLEQCEAVALANKIPQGEYKCLPSL